MDLTLVFILLAIVIITIILLLRSYKRQENYKDNPRYITGTPYLPENSPEYDEYNQYAAYDEYSGCDKPINPIYVQYDEKIKSTLPESNKMWTAPDSGVYVNFLQK